MSENNLTKYEQDVLDAWNDFGLHPMYHAQKRDQLRRQWPELANALDRLSIEARR